MSLKNKHSNTLYIMGDSSLFKYVTKKHWV